MGVAPNKGPTGGESRASCVTWVGRYRGGAHLWRQRGRLKRDERRLEAKSLRDSSEADVSSSKHGGRHVVENPPFRDCSAASIPSNPARLPYLPIPFPTELLHLLVIPAQHHLTGTVTWIWGARSLFMPPCLCLLVTSTNQSVSIEYW